MWAATTTPPPAPAATPLWGEAARGPIRAAPGPFGAVRVNSLTIATPVGRLLLSEAGGAILRLRWSEAEGDGAEGSPLLREAARQIEAYFDRRRRSFDLPLRLVGSDFQQRVWARLAAIPFGQTLTYGEIARALSCAAQPVGVACGANPIPLIIPCHRVLGARSLGGFSGGAGVETKVALLRHEGAAGLLI